MASQRWVPDMHRHPSSDSVPEAGGATLADSGIGGNVVPLFAPHRGSVAALLLAASGPAEPRELRGESEIRAAFRTAVLERPHSARRRRQVGSHRHRRQLGRRSGRWHRRALRCRRSSPGGQPGGRPGSQPGRYRRGLENHSDRHRGHQPDPRHEFRSFRSPRHGPVRTISFGSSDLFRVAHRAAVGSQGPTRVQHSGLSSLITRSRRRGPCRQSALSRRRGFGRQAGPAYPRPAIVHGHRNAAPGQAVGSRLGLERHRPHGDRQRVGDRDQQGWEPRRR